MTSNISFEDLKNENVDLENIPVEEVFQQLKCTKEGLTTEEGQNRLQIFGPNKLEEKKESKFLKFLGFMWNPLSWVMESAAIMAIALANGGGKPTDWPDFLGIVVLLLINSTISFIEENNAGNAAAALMAGLAPKTKVLRDGKWREEEAAILVPGDMISIKLGDIIPADARLMEGDPLKIDQSALTGESLPATKYPGDEVFSGSTCKQGELEAVVIATGVHTFFGKAAHLVDSTNNVGHFQKVLTSIGNFCICSIAVGMFIEIVVMYPIQHRAYRDGIDNLLVLLIGGIPIAMPTVLSVTMAIGSHRLSQQGAITKRMTAIEEMAGMDVLCSDKTGTLTLNKLTVDKNLIEVFLHGVDKDALVLDAARASRVENQDAIDASIVGMLGDPKEARAGITEVHFLPFNPVEKRTAITYIDQDGNWHRTSKGAPEQIIDLCEVKGEANKKAHAIIAGFADRGLRSLAVARQTVSEKSKESKGEPWEFLGLLPLFDPPRHDSSETIRRALDLGVNVKMITGDQLAIGKETGRRLGMGTNMYPSTALLGEHKDESLAGIPIDELIEKADGFAGVFPEHKYEIVKRLQDMKHICGMTGDGVNDAPALKRADIGIAVADATDAARSASDIVLTEPGLSVIVSAVLTSRAIFQRMKNYTIYAVSITIRIVFGFMFVALIWQFDFSPFMVLIIAVLNDGTIMTISKDRVKPSPRPDTWKLKEIFATGVVLGAYMAIMTVVFFYFVHDTNLFTRAFGVKEIAGNNDELNSALYLQVSIISQALIFVTRSRSWSYVERPGILLMGAFLAAQMVATLIAVYAEWEFCRIRGIGWRWAGVIWLYSIITYIPLDILKFLIRLGLTDQKFLGFMWNPLSWVMESAAIMAIALANGGGKPTDWPDFLGIVVLLLINSTISFIEENNAGNAAAALMAGLAPKTKVLRDGKWREEEAAILVPGDMISIKLGDIIPADARLMEGDPLKIDQSALTGESLPATKYPGDEVFSGSTCKQGELEAVVIATGVHTFFGKAAHLVDSTNNVGHFQKVLTSIGNFCICSIAVGMFIEIVVMYPIQHRAYRDGIDNLLVLLIGGIPIAMPTVLSVTMAIGSHRLSQQGAITKRMTAIEEMAGMDVLCSDKTGTLTLNKLTVDKNLIEVFPHGVDKDALVLDAARASRVENQDAIDASIVGMLGDPKEARAGITEVHFLPFNPVEKRTAITYIDQDGNWHRTSKGAPEQIIDLCEVKGEANKKAHAIIAGFADRGLRSLAVARQTVSEKSKESKGEPWEFLGLLPLFDPPRHDSSETIRRALDLGVNVKMITGDQLAIGKETGRRLGMGTNMYPSTALLGEHKDESLAGIPIDELIEKADGFAGVFPEHKYEIVKRLQDMKHICGMTGDGVNDAPALKRADIGIAVADATDAARSASDIVLTEPGLSVIVSAVLTSRAIFQRMKNYTIYAVSITIRIVFGFMFVALIWQFDFSPFMVLIIAVLNDGTIMTISKDRVKPSPRPDTWKLKEIFATGVVLGAYMAIMTVVFFYFVHDTNLFTRAFGVKEIAGNNDELNSALYLQVSIISQALIFVTRSRSWSYVERPGILLMGAFLAAQMVATLIAVYAEWEFCRIRGIGWRWAGVIWLYSIITYIPLDILKFLIRLGLTGRAWDNMLQNKTAFTTKKDYGKGEREAQWATAQRTLHGLQAADAQKHHHEQSDIVEQAKKRAEAARLRELHTLKGHVESVVKLKGLDIDTMQQHYTV